MSLITAFDPWKSNLCTCPPKYSLSAYTGCGHGCLYCYASSYIRDFSRPREKKDFLKRLDKEIKKLSKGAFLAIANSSDPYLPLEKKLKLTREALKIIGNYELKINIITKSPLILRDIALLKELKSVVISISLTTLDEPLTKKLEPGAPSSKERLKTIKELSSCLPIVVRLDPLIYPLNTDKVKNLVKKLREAGAKQIITSTYKIKPDNFKKMTAVFPQYKELWSKLYLKQGEKKGGYTYLPEDLRKKLIKEVREVTLSEELEFSSCREGFDNLNTAACDGSSFLT